MKRLKESYDSIEDLYDIIESDEGGGEIFDELTEKFMDRRSPCKKILGEVLAAANRVLYRWYNDGDRAGEGYGNETVNAPIGYLFWIGVFNYIGEPFTSETVERTIENLSNTDDRSYEAFLSNLKMATVDWVRDHIEEALKDNDETYLDYDLGIMYKCSECGAVSWNESDIVCPEKDDYAFDVSDYLDNPEAEDYVEEAWNDHGYEDGCFCKHCWDNYRREVAADADHKWEEYLEEYEDDEDW